MKKQITHKSDGKQELAGSEEAGARTWMQGYNCIYRNPDGPKAFRVAIKTTSGWKTIGFFDDLPTAAYVANVAILSHESDEGYELNNVDYKNDTEFRQWRSLPGSRELEDIAKARFISIKAAQDIEHQEKANRKKEKQRRYDDEVNRIVNLPNPDLVDFIKSTDKFSPFYEEAMREAVARFNKLKVGKRAT